MRILFATTAGAGHFTPMVPLAEGCRAAGHDVAVAAPSSFAGAVERTGLAHLPFADAADEQMGAVFARLPGLSFDEANEVVVREVFAGLDARAALPGLDETVGAWQPDVIVRDPAEFASYVVAERRGVPHVSVAIGPAAVEDAMLSVVDDALRDLGAGRGSGGLLAAPVLSLVPSVLDGPRADGGPVVRLRYETAPPSASAALPRWGDPEAPLVYVSYGTVTAGLAPFAAIYPATVAALADRPVRALVTVGDSGDPATLGPLPENVLVERFRPQQDVMPFAAAVIGHGGFGTTMTALAHGVPLVVLPLFALDQRINALAVAGAGAGVALDGGPADVGRLGEALDAVLGDASFGTGARRVADEISALPPAATTAAVLAQLVG
jgi:UDP:flavonoid glycosyltransferase YjiC (YdhE family)